MDLTPRIKKKETWREETEVEAFKNSRKEALEGFEELQETAREMESDPGYFSRLIAKIIDNLEVLCCLSLR